MKRIFVAWTHGESSSHDVNEEAAAAIAQQLKDPIIEVKYGFGAHAGVHVEQRKAVCFESGSDFVWMNLQDVACVRIGDISETLV